MTLNHEKGTGTAAPVLVYATLGGRLSGGASPFFMAGTVPLCLHPHVLTNCQHGASPLFRLTRRRRIMSKLFMGPLTADKGRRQLPEYSGYSAPYSSRSLTEDPRAFTSELPNISRAGITMFDRRGSPVIEFPPSQPTRSVKVPVNIRQLQR
jgi:hypothetical protein